MVAGITPASGTDYAQVFDETLRIAGLIRETGLVVFPVLGIHPAEISRLTERMPLADAAGVMKGGLECAAGYVRDGRAVALKSGRPHYEVSSEVLAASNDVLFHALGLAAGYRCALQIHAESGPCADIVDMARVAGMTVERVVKHYGSPETPLHPSLVARHEAVPVLARERRPFTMESDFMDENSRPGAVTGPKSVPRITKKLLESGVINEEGLLAYPRRDHRESLWRPHHAVERGIFPSFIWWLGKTTDQCISKSTGCPERVTWLRSATANCSI